VSGLVLEVERLSAHYGQLQALFDVDLAVAEGETVAVIGANGAGKSTLLRAIAGAVPATGGTIRYDGADLAGVPPWARVGLGIAIVPEGRHIFPTLSAEENLLVGGFRGRPGPWTIERVYEVFPLLRPLARRSGANLSGGEQQALAIGRALMANPRLVLLDEMSLGLAPVVVDRLYRALPDVAASGTTAIIVEQDIGQALQVADRVVCLLEGRVSLTGRPSDFGRDHIVAAYFGM
jgi:branched-chain amino acid transport system ATP-binding protein